MGEQYISMKSSPTTNTDDADNMPDKDERITRWEPRIIRHLDSNGHESFAIHDVYFNASHEVVAMTEDALSVREPTVHGLEHALFSLMRNSGESARTGDLNYEYNKGDLADWLSSFELPVLEYI